MKKIAAILLILVGAIALNAYGQADTTTTIQQDKAITLQIEGMSCEFCAWGLKSSLEKLDGISIHEIDPKEGFAKLSFKQPYMPSDEILKETVENAGFKLTKVQRNKENDSDQDSWVMSLELVVFLAAIALLLHTPWELAQTKALSTCAGKPWPIRLRNCSIGIVSDVLYTVGLFYLIGWWLSDYQWLSKAGIVHYSFVFLLSFLGAYLTELVAQRLGWWHFNRKVPHFPKSLGDVAVTPVLQLPVLVVITYLTAQFMLL